MQTIFEMKIISGLFPIAEIHQTQKAYKRASNYFL